MILHHKLLCPSLIYFKHFIEFKLLKIPEPFIGCVCYFKKSKFFTHPLKTSKHHPKCKSALPAIKKG